MAGVRVSTMTPPMRSGRRVVFVSLDDGTGAVDCAFFSDAQARSGQHLFGTRMLLARSYYHSAQLGRAEDGAPTP